MLHVGHLNIYHLDNKVADICNHLHQTNPPFHLYGITESRLHSRISNNSVRIPDYDIIRRDATLMNETGIAAYVHKSIVQFIRRRVDLEHSSIECMWLELRSKAKSPSILVGFLYRNPASPAEWYKWFTEMIDNVYKTKPDIDILILGDFNIDLKKTQPRWQTVISSLGLTQLIKVPTRVTQNSETLLDHIYSNNPSSVVSAAVLDLSISDHSPIRCSKIAKVPKLNKNMHTSIKYRSFKHFDSQIYLYNLSSVNFHHIYNINDPNNALDAWYNLFLSVLNKHAPIKSKRVKHPKLPQWISTDILKAMAQRDQLKKSKNFIEYKSARNKIKNMIRDSKRSYFNRMVQNNSDTATLWRALNTFIKGKGNLSSNIPLELTPDVFNRHFLTAAPSLLGNDISEPSEYMMPKKLQQFVLDKTPYAEPLVIPPVSVNEVGHYVSKLANKKSSGLDEISAYVLKLSLPYIVDTLTYIFNLCITQNVFPQKFKNAKVIPIHKSGTTKDVNNYRPISLLPVLSKILERHIHTHITDYLEHHSLFHQFQSGFRRNHSCASALSVLSNQWLTAVNNSKLSGCVFLDFSKAFDLVNHTILLKKLELYFNSSKSVTFIQSFLSNRKQTVFTNGCYSTEGPVTFGVPQGSVLGPLLFCIFINDLPLQITNSAVECHMLADDTTLQSANSSKKQIEIDLNKALCDISVWCKQNNMILNPSKSKCMLITTRQKHQLSKLTLDLSINDTSIDQVSEHKLLGIIIDDKLQWQPHIDHLCKILSKNLYLLSKLQSVITLDARKLFYNAHIKPHLDYASIIWDGISENLFKRLNSMHRRTAKLIQPEKTMTTDEKLSSAGMLSLKDLLKCNKLIFIYKILNHKAPSYLQNMFTHSHSYYTSYKQNLILPKPRIDIYKTSLSYSGAALWNSLPICVRTQNNLKSFKINLHKFIRNTHTNSNYC